MAGPPDTGEFRRSFDAFSSFGDKNHPGVISLKNIDKWMRQSNLFDKHLNTVDTAIAFNKITQGAKLMTYAEYSRFLDEIATQTGKDRATIINKLASCAAPGTTHATRPISSGAAASAMDRLTDTSKYTGTHKERFDKSGHGKGLEGRMDIADSSGYVQGYKGKDTYDETHEEAEPEEKDDDEE